MTSSTTMSNGCEDVSLPTWIVATAEVPRLADVVSYTRVPLRKTSTVLELPATTTRTRSCAQIDRDSVAATLL